MTFIIAAVAILVIIGSVMWLKPSPTQRRQTRMRLLARQLGLDVRLSGIPQTRRARVRQERPEQGVVYRWLQFGDNKNGLTRDYVWCRDDANSAWEIESPDGLPSSLLVKIEAIFTELPTDARAVEIAPNGPGIYWMERGGEDAVRGVQQLLHRLQQLLLEERF
jgi:hypothetical protein